jgi:hypothetical protein
MEVIKCCYCINFAFVRKGHLINYVLVHFGPTWTALDQCSINHIVPKMPDELRYFKRIRILLMDEASSSLDYVKQIVKISEKFAKLLTVAPC